MRKIPTQTMEYDTQHFQHLSHVWPEPDVVTQVNVRTNTEAQRESQSRGNTDPWSDSTHDGRVRSHKPVTPDMLHAGLGTKVEEQNTNGDKKYRTTQIDVITKVVERVSKDIGEAHRNI